MSRTTLDLDDEALAGAMHVAPDNTKTEVINQALREYASRRAFQELLELEGKVAWEGDLDALRKGTTSRPRSCARWKELDDERIPAMKGPEPRPPCTNSPSCGSISRTRSLGGASPRMSRASQHASER